MMKEEKNSAIAEGDMDGRTDGKIDGNKEGKIEAVIFDLDGTMWDAVDEILHTWNQVVAAHPECGRGQITQEELSGCLGLPMTEIAERLFPGLEPGQHQILLDECCRLENAYLSEHGATLYPELEKTLRALKEQYKLLVVSNCQPGYIESFIKAHGLGDCFDDIECWGNNKRSKGENNRLIMERNHVARAVYVGDTAGDERSASEAGIPFIFARYGFGQAEAPDYELDAFAQLPGLLEKIRM